MPKILQNGIYALAVCSILVIVCYFFFDKPVAIWISQKQLPNYVFLDWFGKIPEFFYGLPFFIYIIFVIFFAYRKQNHLLNVLLVMANSIVITAFFKTLLKIAFGRYWPLTWRNNNLSLIKDNVYGFHFLHGGLANSAFPSGHTAIIVAAMTVLWMLYPRWCWLYGLLILLTITGLIGMNYHFVGDVVAGGFLGALVGYYVVTISGLKANSN